MRYGISINMAKREQIWLPDEEYIGYCSNHSYAYVQYIDVNMCKI